MVNVAVQSSVKGCVQGEGRKQLAAGSGVPCCSGRGGASFWCVLHAGTTHWGEACRIRITKVEELEYAFYNNI